MSDPDLLTSSGLASFSAHTLLKKLCDTFPVFQETKPLAIGIHKAIFDRLPEIPQLRLRHALAMHTASTRYLKALATSEQRFDLDGRPAGSVTDEQRKQAAQELRERFKRNAERRRQEQAEQERKAKLQQLVAKFDRHS